MTSTVLLSLGSNLGDRREQLRAALDALDALDHTRLTACSRLYETAPVGEVDQPAFYNIAAAIETAFEPLELLAAVKEIERRLGRTNSYRWGPRAIDIDLVLWIRPDNETQAPRVLSLAYPRLTLPHPAYRDRAFVLQPLAEIAPHVVDPETGATVAALADHAHGAVKALGPLDS